MNTLAIAFGLAWTAVAAYVGWIGFQNRRLARRLDALHAEQPASSVHRHSARAA